MTLALEMMDTSDKLLREQEGVWWVQQLVFNNIALRLSAVLAGLGLAYLLEDQVQAHLAEGRLVRVLADWCPPFSGYHLYYPSRRQSSPAFALIVDALRYRVWNRVIRYRLQSDDRHIGETHWEQRAECPLYSGFPTSREAKLNPVENIWQFIRDNWLSNRVFKSYDDILDLMFVALVFIHKWVSQEQPPW
jgi:hypothetical protein